MFKMMPNVHQDFFSLVIGHHEESMVYIAILSVNLCSFVANFISL